LEALSSFDEIQPVPEIERRVSLTLKGEGEANNIGENILEARFDNDLPNDNSFFYATFTNDSHRVSVTLPSPGNDHICYEGSIEIEQNGNSEIINVFANNVEPYLLYTPYGLSYEDEFVKILILNVFMHLRESTIP